MVDEHAIDRQNLSAALNRAITQQELFQAEMSVADKESEVAGLLGSELERDTQRIAIDIDRIKSDIIKHDALAQERSILLATQQRELSKLKREKTVRRRTTRASMSSQSTGGTTPIKVNDAAVGKARILHDANPRIRGGIGLVGCSGILGELARVLSGLPSRKMHPATTTL